MTLHSEGTDTVCDVKMKMKTVCSRIMMQLVKKGNFEPVSGVIFLVA